MNDRHEYGRQFDAKVYDQEYFEGTGSKSGYQSYTQAKEIVQDQFSIINDIMKPRVLADGEATVHIDVGCAYGFGVQRMKDLGWVSVGGDISEFAVNEGRRLNPGIEIAVSDARQESFWKGFNKVQAADLVTAVEFFEHIASDEVDSVLSYMASSARWGLFVINARTAPGQDVQGSHGDHGHLNNHTMTWWITKFAKYGEIDYEAMFEFSKRAEAYNREVHWHNRCLVIKFINVLDTEDTMAKANDDGNFMHQTEEVDVGYFDKRKEKFNAAIRKGIGENPQPKRPAKKAPRGKKGERS